MTTPIKRWLWLVLAFVLSVGLARAENASKIAPLGNDTYRVSVTATHKFTRNTQKLKDQALAAAQAFCTENGKQLELMNADEDKSFYLMGGFAQVTLTFKALDPAPPAPATPAPPSPAEVAPATPTDTLYAELTKLDELRKKGILTEDEFAAEKKKVLARSK